MLPSVHHIGECTRASELASGAFRARARARTVLQGLNYNGTLTIVIVVAHNNAMAPQREKRAWPIMCAASTGAHTYIHTRAREQAIMYVRERERRYAPTALYLYRVIIVLVLNRMRAKSLGTNSREYSRTSAISLVVCASPPRFLSSFRSPAIFLASLRK